MIKILSNWAKGLGVAIVVVSILEMLLPNNKTKKYVKMVMGIYILFNIISPFIQNKEIFDINNFNLNDYVETGSIVEVNQKSMDDRIQELYIEELEKDIKNKLTNKGYEIEKCKVTAKLENNKDESKVTKIRIIANKREDSEYEETSEKGEKENNENKVENKIVTEIQKIRKVDTSINVNNKEKTNQTINENQVDSKNNEDKKLSKTEIQNIKKFLIEEYGVSEKCLEIN